MEKQNITLALPRDMLRRVKVMAAEKGTSISGLLEDLLQERLERHEGYAQAAARQVVLMKKGLELGTGGNTRWARDELHER